MKIIGFIILFPILILFYSCGDPNPQQTDNITSLDEFRIKVIKKTRCNNLIMQYNQDETYNRTTAPDRAYNYKIKTPKRPKRAAPT